MLELTGYYDGASVQLLSAAQLKKNQKLKIIVMNDFVDEPQTKPVLTTNDRAQRAYARILSLTSGQALHRQGHSRVHCSA